MNSFLNFHEGKNLRMLASNPVSTILNWLGNILALLFFATPLYQIFKKRLYVGSKIKNMPLFLILTIIFNCLFWLLQAFSSEDLGSWVPLLISNIIGLIMNVSLLFFYLYIFLQKDIKKFLGYGFFVVDLMIEISYLIFRYVVETNGSFHLIGLVATVINILMYSSPLQNIKKIMKEKKYEALPILTLIIGLLTTLTFLIKGILDYFTSEGEEDAQRSAVETMVSNGISFLLLGILAGIYTYFFCNKKERDEITKEDIEKGDVEKIVDTRDSTATAKSDKVVYSKDKKESKKKKKKSKEAEEEEEENEEDEAKKKKKSKKKIKK